MRNHSREMKKLNEEIRNIRKTFSKKECLHPDAPHNCRGRIVKAHTVQKRGGLTKIADDGHVLAPNSYKATTEFTRIGINRASTFTGFRKYHDDTLFAPIEKFPLNLTRRHAFLLAFRVVSHEFFLKRRAVEIQIPDGTPFPEIMLKYQAGARLAITDLETVHQQMGKALKSCRFRDSNYYAVEFDRVPGMSCSGTPCIEFDFHGNRLQSLNRQDALEIITFSILPFRENRGVAVFAWFGKSNVNKRFIKSLSSLPKNDIPDALVRFAFQSLENMFLAPTWWNNLSDATKERLTIRYDSSFGQDEFAFIDLRPDGVRSAQWKVTGKPRTNVAV